MRRLRGREGASITYALLFMLVAAMVIIVILTSAVTAAKRVKSDIEARQTELALDSAGQLLRDLIQQDGLNMVVTWTQTIPAGESQTPSESAAVRTIDFFTSNGSRMPKKDDGTYTNMLIPLIQNAWEAVSTAPYDSFKSEGTLTLSAEGVELPADAADSEKIKVTMMMEKAGDLTDLVAAKAGYGIKLTCTVNGSHTIVVEVPASVIEGDWTSTDNVITDEEGNSVVESKTHTKTRKISWNNARLTAY